MSNDMDIPISEQVAKEASEKVCTIKHELEDNKDSYIAFMKDVLTDSREHSRFLKKVVIIAFVVLGLTIAGVFGLTVYNQRAMKAMADENARNLTDMAKQTTEEFMNFLTDVDLCSEYEMIVKDESFNLGDMNVTR